MARSRPHFKVHTTVLYHPKMRGLMEDNELLGLWTKLGALAIDRYAAKNGGTFSVSNSEMCQLTNRQRIDSARLVARKLDANSPLIVSSQGDHFLVTIPNLLKKQGFKSKNVQELTTPECRVQNTDCRVQSERTSPKKNTPEKSEPDEDDSPKLSDGRIKKLIEMRPGGVAYSESEVRAWFASVVPKMRYRGITDFNRAAGNWWPRTSRQDVEDAVQWNKIRDLDSVRESVMAESRVVSEEQHEDFMRLMSKPRKTRRERRVAG